ncbi:MAG: hypothetical protein WCG67_06010 [Ferruginibacter sp.]
MNRITRIFLLIFCCIAFDKSILAQLTITTQSNAQQLVQKLLGNGIVVSNISLILPPLQQPTLITNRVQN